MQYFSKRMLVVTRTELANCHPLLGQSWDVLKHLGNLLQLFYGLIADFNNSNYHAEFCSVAEWNQDAVANILLGNTLVDVVKETRQGHIECDTNDAHGRSSGCSNNLDSTFH